MKMHPHAIVMAASLLAIPPAFSQSIVADDLITGSSQSTEWLICDTDSPAVDVSILDAGGCAFRTTPAEAGITFRMSCGVTVAKFASITLAFLDASDNTLSTDTTEVFEHESGAYSVTAVSPPGTATAAIGIYGEPGSGFQDCVLLDVTPAPEPTKGSITGLTWFDANSDNIFDENENVVTSTDVSLFLNGALIQQSETSADGSYYFGHLDVEMCYTVMFAAADATLQLGLTGGSNDALSNGFTNDICLTETTPDVGAIDAAFVAIPPPVPPADNTICGSAFADANGNGSFDSNDTNFANIPVKLLDAAGDQIRTTTTNQLGFYAFNELPVGDYQIMFATPDAHEVSAATIVIPRQGENFVNAEGMSPRFNLPSDGNTPPNFGCTIQHVNAGFTPLPVALEPTIANDDEATQTVGQDFSIDFLANDDACEGSVVEIDILGHNLPGRVTYNFASQRFDVSSTTAPGNYSIEYGIRGACGSYDTATININLIAVILPPPPAAPDAPRCRIETRGDSDVGGVDVFSVTENGFSPIYNLYDRDRNLVTSVSSDDVTHLKFHGPDVGRATQDYVGNYEIEWNGTAYGYDQTSIYFISAVENGIESQLTECDRTFISPIAIDLDDQGRIHRIPGEYTVDMDGDGSMETLSQWFGPKAGILVTADAKGKINGDYMFGNVSGVHADGFAKLATLDSNSDGELTETELSTLAIWTDSNSDTIVNDGELSTLASHQITTLEVDHYKFMARATKATGKRILMEDVWLPLAPVLTAENR